MKLDITEQMLFALLRSALHGTHADATIFAGITSEAWQECYRLSVRPVSYTHLRSPRDRG